MDNSSDDSHSDNNEFNSDSEHDAIMFDDERDEEPWSTTFKKTVQKISVQFPPITENFALLYLHSVWSTICPPTEESEVANSWFAVIYHPDVGQPKPKFYVGKAIRRFLQEKGSVAQFLEIQNLPPAFTPTTTELLEFPPHLGRDVCLFPIPDIIAGPLQRSYLGQGKWNFPDYPDCVTTFMMVSKMARNDEYAKFLCLIYCLISYEVHTAC